MSIIRFLCSLVLCAAALSSTALAEGGFSSLGNNRFLAVDEAFRFSSSVEPGVLRLSWNVAEGYYLYKDRIKVALDQPGVVLEEIKFSIPGKPKDDPYFGLVEVFTEDVSVEVPIVSAGGSEELLFKISYQGCADAGLCYPPQTREALYLAATPANISVTGGNEPTRPPANTAEPSQASPAPALTQNPTNTPTAQTPAPASPTAALDTASAQSLARYIEGAGLWQILALFFLLGIGLAFTPCVFPMIPILSTIIAGQRKATLRTSFVLSLAYVVGVAAMYGALGFVVGHIGAGTSLQAYLQEPWILTLFAALFVLLALSMFGFYELQLPAFLRDRLTNVQQSQSGGTLASVFLMGVISALVVSPCVSAPLAGALIYIATTGDATFGAMVLFTLALGMGLPLLAVGTGAGRLLPKAGAWMVAVKAVFGVMLLGVAIWLLERFLAGPVTLALWAILAGVSAVYLGAFESAKTQWQRFWKGLGLLLFVYSILLLIGASSGGSHPLRPLASLSSFAQAGSGTAAEKLDFVVVHDLEQLDQQVSQASRSGLPVMVDVYADWCISCKIMERDTFPHPEIKRHLSGMRLIKADVTANDAGNQALLAKFGLFGPPGILFYDKQGQELSDQRIYGEIDTLGFQRHLERLPL